MVNNKFYFFQRRTNYRSKKYSFSNLIAIVLCLLVLFVGMILNNCFLNLINSNVTPLMLLFYDFKVCYFMSSLLPTLWVRSGSQTIKYGLSLLNSISFSNSSETTGRDLVNVNSKESSVPNYSGSDFYQWLVGLTDNAIRYAPASCLN